MVYFLCKAYDSDRQNCYFAQSLPVRGAWVEIRSWLKISSCGVCRSPCGERGLKSSLIETLVSAICRSPCGERGLKYQIALLMRVCAGRSPCGERGLKLRPSSQNGSQQRSLPVRGAWVEITARDANLPCVLASLPVRGAWVEIAWQHSVQIIADVAPRAGSVG